MNPAQLHGLEINPYAQELAQVVIWIGYLQWMHFNGFKMPDHPVLTPIETIRRMDAIVDLSDPEHPKEPEWPEAEFIVGNPPFLGGKRMLSELGEEYMAALRQVWDDRLSRFSDLCCYWFEKSRKQIEDGKSLRAGLLATQGIRGGANRKVLERIKSTGDIFFAESDRNWILDGATVHVSMAGFDNGQDTSRVLDGKTVEIINPNLATGSDTTTAQAEGKCRVVIHRRPEERTLRYSLQRSNGIPGPAVCRWLPEFRRSSALLDRHGFGEAAAGGLGH